MNKALILVMLGISGCAGAESRKALNETNEILLTHCRIGTVENSRWPISKIEEPDIKSGDKRNYEIVEEYKDSPAARITFDKGDRFKIESANATAPVILKHFRKATEIARATIKIDQTSGLWASGEAFKTGETESVGEYFVFRTRDADGTPWACRHSKNKGGSCRTLHFEYFDSKDTADILDKKPKLADNNVVELSKAPGCEEYGGSAESDDGDGDEGPDN